MKHILQVLRFEYLGIIKSKAFIITTVLFLVLIIGMAFLPGLILSIQSSGDEKKTETDKQVIAVVDKAYKDENTVKSEFAKSFEGYKVLISTEDNDTLSDKVDKQDYAFAVVIDEPLAITYITKNNSLFASQTARVAETVKGIYQTTSFDKLGVPAEISAKIISSQPTLKTVTTGTDQTKNYLSAYILMMMIYMAVILYGQLVAQSVVSEKNTRTMEMLITCAKPSHLMFGKVFGSGLAGITQLAVIVCTAVVSMRFVSMDSLPAELREMMNFPVDTALYALLFFVLGYFIYSFLLGAFASFASRSEDLNTLISPVMLMIVAIFMIVVIAINSGTVDSPLMIVCSYIPFTAPIAMFARVALSDVSIIEIIISVVIQLVSIYLLGMLAAAIYRVGVLMYGKVPKPSAVIKLLSEQHKTNKAIRASKKGE